LSFAEFTFLSSFLFNARLEEFREKLRLQGKPAGGFWAGLQPSALFEGVCLRGDVRVRGQEIWEVSLFFLNLPNIGRAGILPVCHL
jgi:hypothetical protein